MKRIVLILALVFVSVWGEESEDSQWRTFIGIEGGVGLNNYYKDYFILAYANPLFSKPNGSAIGYHLALNLGW